MPNAQLTPEQVQDEAEKLFLEQAKAYIIATSDKPGNICRNQSISHSRLGPL